MEKSYSLVVYALFVFLICSLASLNQIPQFHNKYQLSQNIPSSSNYEIRVLLGILTLPDQHQRRHILRLVYGTQSVARAKIDVKFVFCNLTKEDHKLLVALEIIRYNDIIILDCEENMNKGKTYTYFSSLHEMFDDDGAGGSSEPPYHYVGKVDDDTYFILENLVESLRPLPRNDLYYGYVIPCSSMDPFKRYMSGMGFFVSWDIVRWIKDSDIPKNHLEGPKDKVFGDWMREGQQGKNWFNAKWSMYNYPDPKSVCSHDFWTETVAVHLLKKPEKWIKTLQFFNVTKNLKPSKLYHLS